MNRVNYIAAAVAGVTLACSSAAYADSIADYVQGEVGIGAAHYTTQDGRWYQQGMQNGDNKLTSKPPAFSLGLTGSLITRGNIGADWHLSYVNLGRAAASCACTPRDENYDANTHHFTNRFDAPAAYFTGSGRSQGVALTIETYRWAYGVRFGVEAGMYAHRDSWSEDVIGWQVDKKVAPQNLHLSDTHWSVAPVVGVSIGYSRFSVAARHYFTRLSSQSRSVPPLWNDADALEIKVRF